MAEYRRVTSTGEIEPKRLDRYVPKVAGDRPGPTPHKCPSCGKPNRYLWLKIQREDSSDLECPVCDYTQTIPRGTEWIP
jgi:hypothetical protein